MDLLPAWIQRLEHEDPVSSDNVLDSKSELPRHSRPSSKLSPRGVKAMTTRRIVTVLVIALLPAGAVPASAQQAKCLVGKTKCMAKKAAGLLKCEQTAETPGKPTDPDATGCVTKVVAKFDGGTQPAKGCFEKLESKSPNDCITLDDTASAEAAVDSCVASFVAAIDPPPVTQTKCGVGKKKCVGKYLASLLKCRQVSETPGKPTDPNATGCVDKAKTKYNGGTEPAKGCFAKLEAKTPNDCQFTDDSATLQALAESCDADLAALVSTPPTTTTTLVPPTTTTTTLPSGGTVLKGALTATPGRFNYNATLGLAGAAAACGANFLGTHPCAYAELQSAEAAGDLVGLKDTAGMTVTSFWSVDSSQPALQQCNDDALGGSGLNWEYATAHTASRGQRAALTNATGVLGALQSSVQCNISGTSWVGCCQ